MDATSKKHPSRRHGVWLLWIPLGAGGAGFVRLNGRMFEAISARRERRPALDLYHTALQVAVGGDWFTIENAWPSPDADIASRGVVVEGPVATRWLGRLRPFRYEVRCWRDGVISDLEYAVGGPMLIEEDPIVAGRVLDAVGSVPARTWGRDQAGVGEMWNSNSVVAWTLTAAGIRAEDLFPPDGGRAPGWKAGIAAANR